MGLIPDDVIPKTVKIVLPPYLTSSIWGCGFDRNIFEGRSTADAHDPSADNGSNAEDTFLVFRGCRISRILTFESNNTIYGNIIQMFL